MKTKNLYDRVLMRKAVDAKSFLAALESAVGYFYSRYGDAIAEEGCAVKTAIESRDCDCGVDGIFFEAFLNNVLYILTEDEDKHAIALSTGDDAYKTLWRTLAREARIRKERW